MCAHTYVHVSACECARVSACTCWGSANKDKEKTDVEGHFLESDVLTQVGQDETTETWHAMGATPNMQQPGVLLNTPPKVS